jgi:hypothetical protein
MMQLGAQFWPKKISSLINNFPNIKQSYNFKIAISEKNIKINIDESKKSLIAVLYLDVDISKHGKTKGHRQILVA